MTSGPASTGPSPCHATPPAPPFLRGGNRRGCAAGLIASSSRIRSGVLYGLMLFCSALSCNPAPPPVGAKTATKGVGSAMATGSPVETTAAKDAAVAGDDVPDPAKGTSSAPGVLFD